ncbi:MAG: dihydrodipicolinate synthase family protein [Pseudomonadota bacterium]
MDDPKLSGVITPLLTPFNADGSIATRLYTAHAARCLADGSSFLSPFGTTGEAASVPVAARTKALEELVSKNAARPDQLIPGTGLTSLADTVALTRLALAVGARAVMILPPYFYRDAEDEGLYRYMAQLIEDVGSDHLRIILYNIPQNTGLGFSPALTRRLSLDYPGIIAGYKDSSGQWGHTVQILRAAPGLAIFPGSESFLPQAMAAGGAGCISASCNVNLPAIRALYDALLEGSDGEAKDLSLEVNHVRKALASAGLITASKAIIATRTNEPDWRRCLPPLRDAPAELTPALAAIAEGQRSAISAT